MEPLQQDTQQLCLPEVTEPLPEPPRFLRWRWSWLASLAMSLGLLSWTHAYLSRNGNRPLTRLTAWLAGVSVISLAEFRKLRK